MLQLYDLCRLCAQKKRHKVALFTDYNEENETNLLAKISVCLSLHVTREDMLPKMICIDCHRTVEQFNAFRVKCIKAEERLNKMLLSLPNKGTITRIKEESLEYDCLDSNNTQMQIDSLKSVEGTPCPILKSFKNVKCEKDDSDSEVYWSSSNNNLIQIISEEIVHQQCFDDVKQPQIEIISENFQAEYKNLDFEYERKDFCEIKVIPEVVFQVDDNINSHSMNSMSECLVNQEISEVNFVEIKEPIVESDEKLITSDIAFKVNAESIPDLAKKKNAKLLDSVGSKIKSNKTETDKKFSIEDITSENEIDEKYLTLREGETCDIDIEEMEALIKKKQNPNALFNCNICNKSFKFFKCLRKHKKWHDSEPNVFICDFCKKDNKNIEFSSIKSLNNHIKKKHLSTDVDKFQCSLCYRTLQSQGQLNAHFRKVHDNSGATCQVCGKKFKNKSCLTGHLKVHQEDRPYVCDLCGQSFKWSNALKVHIQWHKQEKNFLCSECGKKFTAKKNLIEHLNIHSGKRPHVCTYCNASFVQLSAYSKHLYLHNEGKKVYKCDKCERSYSHAYMLKQHLIRHSDLRPYECSVCHHSFKSQSDLCSHTKIHQEKQFDCQVCGRKFALSKTLRDHMVRHTGIKHICPVPDCGKTYTQRFSLTKHFCKQHPGFSIVRKKSGKKAYLCEKSMLEKEPVVTDFIRYDFTEKGDDILFIN